MSDVLLQIHSRRILTHADHSWGRLRYALREPFAEFLGMLVLIVLGVGADCQVKISQTTAGDSSSVNWTWGFGVMSGICAPLPLCLVSPLSLTVLHPSHNTRHRRRNIWRSPQSGTHHRSRLLPRIPLADGESGSASPNAWVPRPPEAFQADLQPPQVPRYILAQILGAFCGAFIIYGNYKKALDSYDPNKLIYDALDVNGMVVGNASASLFVTVPNISVGGTVQGFCQEILATAVLAVIVLALGDEVSFLSNFLPTSTFSLTSTFSPTSTFSLTSTFSPTLILFATEQRPARSWTRSSRPRVCRDCHRHEHGLDFRCKQ